MKTLVLFLSTFALTTTVRAETLSQCINPHDYHSQHSNCRKMMRHISNDLLSPKDPLFCFAAGQGGTRTFGRYYESPQYAPCVGLFPAPAGISGGPAVGRVSAAPRL